MCGYIVCVRIFFIFYFIFDLMVGSFWIVYFIFYDYFLILILSKLEIRFECFILSENWLWNNRIDFDNLLVFMDR